MTEQNILSTEAQILADLKIQHEKSDYEKEILDQLNPKNLLFIMEYIKNCFNAKQAYIKIFKVKDKVAEVNASKLLRNPKVKKVINLLLHKLFTSIYTDIEKSKTYKLIHDIGNTTIGDIVTWENDTLHVKDLKDIPSEALCAIQSIESVQRDTKYGTEKNIKVKLVPKVSILELRAKIQKMLDPDNDNQNIEITVIPPCRPLHIDNECR